MEYENSDDNEEGSQDVKKKQDPRIHGKEAESKEDNEDDDSDIDDNVKRVDHMADDMDAYYNQRKEYKMEKDKKLAKKEKKMKALLE